MRAVVVNVFHFRLGELKFSRLFENCQDGKRFHMDTPDINENSKTSTRRVEIGQRLPQTLYLLSDFRVHLVCESCSYEYEHVHIHVNIYVRTLQLMYENSLSLYRNVNSPGSPNW